MQHWQISPVGFGEQKEIHYPVSYSSYSYAPLLDIGKSYIFN
jgi:hypothetical protein